MDRLLVLSPLFNKGLAVDSYVLGAVGYGAGTGEGMPPLFSDLFSIGLQAFAKTPVFIPVYTPDMLDQAARHLRNPAWVVLLLERELYPLEGITGTVREMKGKGYRFAARGSGYPLLPMLDYLLCDEKDMRRENRKAFVRALCKDNPRLNLVATGLDDRESYERAVEDGFPFLHGVFYRSRLSAADQKITPLKANLIRLLNIVRNEDYEYSTVSQIVRQDPALSVSLMRFVNSPYIGVRNRVRSINQAVTLLGQDEVRKWVTAAVFKSLGTDKPGELTRLSLLRARLAELLAPAFGLGEHAQSLFLMGLLSALDTILEVSADKALDLVPVSAEIGSALLEGNGPYYPVLRFLQDYEQSDWGGVAASCGQFGFSTEQARRAYLAAAAWYDQLISETVKPVRPKWYNTH